MKFPGAVRAVALATAVVAEVAGLGLAVLPAVAQTLHHPPSSANVTVTGGGDRTTSTSVAGPAGVRFSEQHANPPTCTTGATAGAPSRSLPGITALPRWARRPAGTSARSLESPPTPIPPLSWQGIIRLSTLMSTNRVPMCRHPVQAPRLIPMPAAASGRYRGITRPCRPAAGSAWRSFLTCPPRSTATCGNSRTRASASSTRCAAPRQAWRCTP